MTRWRAAVVVVVALMTAGLVRWSQAPDGVAPPVTRVAAAAYRAFWLWGGVRPQPVLAQAERLYLLQGQVQRDAGRSRLQPQGVPPSALAVRELWLSYRVSTLDWSPEVVRDLLRQRAAWQARGNRVIGIQIDFDAATPALADYARFLRHLRRQLPAECQLGITGLLDWGANGDIATLNGLHGVVDELVVQTYRGRHTVANYAAYLPALRQLTLPFRLGLVQHGEWDPRWQRQFAAQSNYRGEVVFLLNSPPVSQHSGATR